jgi:hypothetical protein
MGPRAVWTLRLEEKSFRLCRGSNLDRPVVQSVATHYTDSATRLTLRLLTTGKINTNYWSSCLLMCLIIYLKLYTCLYSYFVALGSSMGLIENSCAA